PLPPGKWAVAGPPFLAAILRVSWLRLRFFEQCVGLSYRVRELVWPPIAVVALAWDGVDQVCERFAYFRFFHGFRLFPLAVVAVFSIRSRSWLRSCFWLLVSASSPLTMAMVVSTDRRRASGCVS